MSADNIIETPAARTSTTVFVAGLVVVLIGAAAAVTTGLKDKRSAINEFILDNGVDLFCVAETWLCAAGDEAKCKDLSPSRIHDNVVPPTFTGGRHRFRRFR